MFSIIKSGLFKLLRDWTFRIILIIGLALAVLMNLIYLGVDSLEGTIGFMCNGQSFYISALSPTQNFGLTVPINLIIFTIGEFNYGTIRNKIIAGHKKSQIYLSLVLIGAIFTLSLMTLYWLFSFGLASLIGGFDVNGGTLLGLGGFRSEYLYQYPLMALCTYIFIVTFAVFISVLVRNIGAAMPIVIITILFLYFVSFISSTMSMVDGLTTEITMSAQGYINPMYTFGTFSIFPPTLDTTWFVSSLVCPLAWAVAITAFGIFVFNKMDVK